MTFHLGNRILTEIHNVSKKRKRIDHISKHWTLEVNRDSVCAGDDTFGHKIVYQIDSDLIDFKEFVSKAFLNQIEIVSCDFNATFLATIVGGSTWRIFLKLKDNEELLAIAKIKINQHQDIEEIIVVPEYSILNAELVNNKIIYCTNEKWV